MSDTKEYAIGAEAYCEDGACGELLRVIVDPIKRAITHLAVGRRHSHDLGRLVPVDLVESATEQELRLRCTRAEFEALEEAKEIELLSTAGDQLGYGPDQTLTWPYFGLRGLGWGLPEMGAGAQQHVVTYDKVPLGEVEVKRGQPVHASDGPIGRTRGLVIDPSDYHVTHVLLDEGHLWGKKEVSIPITAVTGVDDDGVRLSLTKDQVGELPPVEVEEHSGLGGDH